MSNSVSRLPTSGTPATIALRIALRSIREEHGVGVRELATSVGVPASTVSAWELGHRNLSPETVAYILGILKVSHEERAKVARLAKAAHLSTYLEHRVLDAPPLSATYEQTASSIIAWAPRLLPDELQAPGYMRTLLATTFPDAEDFDLPLFRWLTRRNALVESRLHRHTVLVGEAALNANIGDQATMLEQLHHLLELSSAAHIVVKVVPETSFHPDLTAARTVYRISGQPDVAALPRPDITLYLNDPADVAPHRAALAAIDLASLSRGDSQKFISGRIHELQRVNGEPVDGNAWTATEA